MKTGWCTEHLRELCDFQRGLIYGKGDEVESSSNVVLRANNIDLSTNRLDFSKLKYISESVAVPANKKVRKGSLLLCTASGSKSHLGKVAFIDDDYTFAFGGFMGQLTPRDKIVPKYLFYFMTSDAYKGFIATLSDGANINNLKFDDLGRLEVPVAPLAEQNRIVRILDEAFEGIAIAKAKAEKNLENVRAVFETELEAVFSQRGKGWLTTTIGDQLTLQRGFDITKDEQSDGEVPVVSSGGVKSFHNKAMVPGPGVVIGRKGTLGKVFYLETPFWPHDTTLWVKDFKGNEPRFVYYFLTSLDVKPLDSGAANPALNRNQVHPIEIIWPPVAQQGPLVATFDALSEEIERLEFIYHRKMDALSALKQSLLHEAFSGNL